MVAAIRLLPGVIATPFAGVLGDRHSRRLVLLACTASTAVVLGLAGVAAGLDAPAAIVYVLAGLFTVVSSPYIPAEGAIFPILARTPQELSAANVARGVADNLGFLLGAVATGFVLVASGPALVFGLTAVAAAVGDPGDRRGAAGQPSRIRRARGGERDPRRDATRAPGRSSPSRACGWRPARSC